MLNQTPRIPEDVKRHFTRLALALIRAGHPHYSADAILHRIRWHHHVDQGDREFKANNNWTPALAREFHREYPAHKDFFQTRQSPHTPDFDGVVLNSAVLRPSPSFGPGEVIVNKGPRTHDTSRPWLSGGVREQPPYGGGR